MRAVVYAGEGRVQVDDVPRPTIEGPGDAIVEISLSAICGSDLHLLDGKTPGARRGAVIGHEYVGRVVDVGAAAGLSEGDRVVGSFLIACGSCRECDASRFNFCLSRRALGLGALTGDLDGAQAEYVRVPNARVNARPLPDGLDDEHALFAGDILATGFYAAGLGEVSSDDSVVVIGAGPVGLCCALAARHREPRLLLVLDSDPKRVAFARDRVGVAAADVSGTDAEAVVNGATLGAKADIVIEAVGAIPAFKSALRCARDGGRVVVVGVYGAERYELALGMSWVRGLNIRFAGMANVQAYWEDTIAALAAGELDPTRIVTHRLPLEEAESGYEMFRARDAMKVLLTP
jgi:threonine dehydrogenase-like Zn-dependent dehydrogenase